MNAPVAQRIEQQPSKLLVVGSNPARGAKQITSLLSAFSSVSNDHVKKELYGVDDDARAIWYTKIFRE